MYARVKHSLIRTRVSRAEGLHFSAFHYSNDPYILSQGGAGSFPARKTGVCYGCRACRCSLRFITVHSGNFHTPIHSVYFIEPIGQPPSLSPYQLQRMWYGCEYSKLRSGSSLVDYYGEIYPVLLFK